MTEDEKLFFDKLCELSAKDAGEIFALQERAKELEARLKTLEDLVYRDRSYWKPPLRVIE